MKNRLRSYLVLIVISLGLACYLLMYVGTYLYRKSKPPAPVHFEVIAVIKPSPLSLQFGNDGLCFDQTQIAELLKQCGFALESNGSFYVATRNVILGSFVPEFNGATKGDLNVFRHDAEGVIVYTVPLQYSWLQIDPSYWTVRPILLPRP